MIPFDDVSIQLHSMIPFHSIPFHSIPFHSIPFHSIPFHSIPFHSIPFHSIPFHSIPFHSIPFHSIPFHSFHSIPFHSIPFHSIPFHSIPFHSIPFHSIPFRSIPFENIAAVRWSRVRRRRSRPARLRRPAVPICGHRPGEDVGATGLPFSLHNSNACSRSSLPSRSWLRNRLTNGLGITRPRRRLTQRSRKNATSRNEQSRMAYISGPASWMMFRKSVVGISAPRLRRQGVGGRRRGCSGLGTYRRDNPDAIGTRQQRQQRRRQSEGRFFQAHDFTIPPCNDRRSSRISTKMGADILAGKNRGAPADENVCPTGTPLPLFVV